MDVAPIYREVMDQAGAGAAGGRCACSVFPEVSHNENWLEASNALVDTLNGIIIIGQASGMTEDQITSSVAHYLTAVVAIGYRMGAAYVTDQEWSVSVPDTLAGLDIIEPRPGDVRPQD